RPKSSQEWWIADSCERGRRGQFVPGEAPDFRSSQGNNGELLVGRGTGCGRYPLGRVEPAPLWVMQIHVDAASSPQRTVLAAELLKSNLRQTGGRPDRGREPVTPLFDDPSPRPSGKQSFW